MQGRRLLLALSCAWSARCAKECGSINVTGYNTPVSIITTKWNTPGDLAGIVRVEDGKVVPYLSGRSYFGDACTVDSGIGRGAYNNSEYVAWMLLGRRLQYTVNMSGANCGCNAALYLTSLRQNTRRSECQDYYCDANSVCGVRCAEIDIQEANTFAWFSTLHTPDDGGGVGGGYGAGRNTWNASDYGPNARCIDTRSPFTVTTAFPTDPGGVLIAVKVSLTQPGKPCSLKMRLDGYAPFGQQRNGLAELTGPLRDGMTPIISYWGLGEDLGWMDGRGPDGQGPCDEGAAAVASCADVVKFSDFALL